MSTLNLNGNYAEQMLSMYLWGQLTPPSPSEIADDKWIRPSDATTTVNIDAQSYMATAGSHLSIANQKIFQLFFNNEHRGGKKLDLSEFSKHGIQNGNEIILNHEQFVKAFYGNHKASTEAKDAQLNLYHYSSGTNSADYWQRAFTFGSTKVQLDTDSVRYVFDATTGQALRLDNVQVKPLSEYYSYNNDVDGDGTRKPETTKENFDFFSNQGVAKQVNPILKQIMDPSGIGRTVEINFINNNQFFELNGGGFTKDDYLKFIRETTRPNNVPVVGGLVHYPDVPETPSPNYLAFLEGIHILNQSNVYDFLDENGKVVIFGTTEGETLEKYKAKNLTLDKDIDLSSIDGNWGLNEFGTWLIRINKMNKFKEHLKNGVTYVSGNGNDTIIATNDGDVLIDTQGFDTYHIKDHDTIYDKDGKGQILFDGKQLPKNFIKRTYTEGIWEANDSKGNILYTAYKKDNDLMILGQGSDKATLKDFFTTATKRGNTYSALSIVLADTQEEADKQGAYTIKANDKYLSNIYTGGFPSNYLDIYGSSRADNIFGTGKKYLTIDAGDGNDLIIGSDMADVIKGGAGNDVIYGSSGFYDFEPENSTKLPQPETDNNGNLIGVDQDLIIGGAGNDLISAGIGNDIIWADDEYEINIDVPVYLDPNNPNNAHINGKGDWILGGRGNDVIHGSANKDFLQGGETAIPSMGVAVMM